MLVQAVAQTVIAADPGAATALLNVLTMRTTLGDQLRRTAVDASSASGSWIRRFAASSPGTHGSHAGDERSALGHNSAPEVLRGHRRHRLHGMTIRTNDMDHISIKGKPNHDLIGQTGVRPC